MTDLVLADYAADGPNARSAFRLQINEAVFLENNEGARYTFTMPGARTNRPQLVLTFIPEPSALALAAISLLGLVACGRHLRKTQ